MLKSLLWKEWRETRLFFFLMVLIVLIFSLLLEGMDYVKETKAGAFAILYILTWVFFTVLMAASQFAGEGESGTLDFLLSRPIHRLKIWLFKIVYGTTSLILFGLFLLLMSMIYISPLLESVTLLDTLLENSTTYIEYTNCAGVLLFISILGLYFLGCTVSIDIRSSFKSVLMTFLVSGGLFFILICSYPEYYFKAPYYIFWIIFPVFLYIIFLKYQPESNLARTAYWVLPIGGILIWAVISLKGGSLWALTVNSYIYGIEENLSDILYFPVLLGGCLSAISTSLFAFGILPRGYPVWWKSLSCSNFITVLAISFSAFLMMLTPVEQSISKTYQSYQPYRRYYRSDRDNNNLSFVIQNSYILKRSASSVYRHPYNPVRRLVASEQYFVLDRDKGKVFFYGRPDFLQGDFQRISRDNRWVVYSCPTLKWGLYYKWGLWAEKLDTSEQFLLMTLNNNNALSGEWFDDDKRFVLFNYDGNRYLYEFFTSPYWSTYKQNSLVLFSFGDGVPKKINEIEIPGSSGLIDIDKKDRLYFYDAGSHLVSCYNRDLLVKEYEITAIQEKFTKFESEFKQPGNAHVYTGIPIISPGGEHMVFSVRGNYQKRNAEGKRVTWIYKTQIWYTSLPDGVSKEFNDTIINNYYYYRWRRFPWHPVEDNLWVDAIISESGDRELRLFDLKNGTTEIILKEKSDARPWTFYFEWSGNGKYLLTYSSDTNTGGVTVNLYEFDSKTRSVSYVSSKMNLKSPGSSRWSTKHTHTAFTSEEGNEIWVLDLNRKKWSKIISPFDNFALMEISNKGEVYVIPAGKIRIYRLTEDEKEIIIQRN